MITKPMQAEYQPENVKPIEDEVLQNRREVVHEAEMHFDPASSKMGDQLTHRVNLGKTEDDYSHRDIPIDWKK